MRKSHKTCFIGMLLVSLSFSVVASSVDVEGIVTSHYEVGCNSDKVSATVQDTDFGNTFVIHAIPQERLYTVTGESTLTVDKQIDKAIFESTLYVDIVTANLVPVEVGWRF
tara:strand:- start:19424 stop:19756 length:333 start_codon:yes stop_codon:yes gene_type:complete